jgi:septum formation protein
MHIVLGSSSPRRKDLLSSLFSQFTVIKPDTDEQVFSHETAHEYCMRVAEEKRESLVALLPQEDALLLISSDTTVSLDDHILGKPEDYYDAERMIRLLQGRTHQVLSALALYVRIGSHEKKITGIESTDVVFKHLSSQDITAYLSSIEYKDKAGSYAAQECGDMIIKRINGSVTNVIGFPLRLFFGLCSDMNILHHLFTYES